MSEPDCSENMEGARARTPINLRPSGIPVTDPKLVIVRLSADLPVSKHDSLAETARELRLTGLQTLLERYDLSSTYRAVRSIGREDIARLEQEAARSAYKPLRSLASYWQIDVRDQTDAVDEILKGLNALPEVEIAYRQRAIGEPGLFVDASDDEFADRQGYLDPAPVGIDARWAWTQPDCQGAEIGFYDLEAEWNEHHEDIFDPSSLLISPPIHGVNRRLHTFETAEGGSGTYSGNHGTAVLGITVARDNDKGVVGIAPAVDKVRLVSHFDGETAGHVVEAILGAIADMAAGEVLLLEVQTLPDLYPVEVDDLAFDAIRLAVAHGIIVIEAAGNGDNNLDDVLDEIGNRVFEVETATEVAFALALNLPIGPTKRIFRDSGAILVGSAHSALPHDRLQLEPEKNGSNYGARIDCFAWGQCVMTCGYGDLGDKCEPSDGPPPGTGGGNGGGFTAAAVDDNNGPGDGGGPMGACYTDDFGGTSAASAIIAGAALVLQGKYQATTGSVLSPGQMRRILSDPSSGTPQGPNIPGHIGPMPDLKKIIQQKLCLVPDVYLRDFPGDTGQVPERDPTTGFSPDIIVSTRLVADPDAAYGEGSNAETSYFRVKPEGGQRNFIYVRMKNRGGSDAEGVRASVYHAPFWTYTPPTEWQLIGRMDPVDVPKGDTLVVAGPLDWDVDSSFDGGALVAVLDHVDDPAPPFPEQTLGNWDGALVWAHNNIAWTGVKVVDELPDTNAPSLEEEFVFAAAPDRERPYEFEIIQRLPEGVKAWLEVPIELAEKLTDRPVSRQKLASDLEIGRVPLFGLPCVPLRVARMPAQARYEARLVIETYGRVALDGHSITIRQITNGREIGRLTWYFSPR